MEKRTKETKPRRKYQFRSPESQARQEAHRFGAPNGNPICPPQVATQQREFYRWVETRATINDLKAYVEDETKPAARRQFVQCLLKCNKVQDFFDLTNQTHGLPRQEVSISAPDKIEIEFFD